MMSNAITRSARSVVFPAALLAAMLVAAAGTCQAGIGWGMRPGYGPFPTGRYFYRGGHRFHAGPRFYYPPSRVFFRLDIVDVYPHRFYPHGYGYCDGAYPVYGLAPAAGCYY